VPVPEPDPRRWWTLGVVAVALLTVALDLTVLHVALPTLAVELGASTSELQWFANAYTLVLAAGLLPAGFLGDQLGQKRLFLGALAVFGVASVACAYARSPETLIAARVLLGVGAAFMIPLSMSLLTVLFPANERGRAIAVWTTTTVIGIPLGPVLGGWLLDHYWWGSVFLINVPLVVLALATLPWLLPRTPGTGGLRVDVPGIALSSAGLVALTYGLTRAGEDGWSVGAVAPTAAGVVLLAGFAVWLRRASHPLFEPGVFRSPGFAAGAGLATVASFAMMGAIFVLPQYFQVRWDTDALGTGLRVMPVVAGLLLGVQAGEPLRRLTSTRTVLVTGMAVLTAGLLVGVVDTGGYWFVALWIALVGVGLGLVIPVAMDLALDALPPGREGVGSGLVQALRQLGGTLGVAVLGTALNAGYRGTVTTDGLPDGDAATVRESAVAGADLAGDAGDPALLDSVRAAFGHGLGALLVVCAVVTATAALAALALRPKIGKDREPELAA
jgi:MFS transporter, DHA2 family, multidrug resistance protein